MSRYNHAFDIAFEVISDHEEGDDITPEMLRDALQKRITSLDESQSDKGEWHEACGLFDTFKVEPKPGEKGFEAWGDDDYYYWSPAEVAGKPNSRRLRRLRNISATFVLVAVVAVLMGAL